MAHYSNDAERIMLSALQLAVDDIARTVATPQLMTNDPFTVARLARIISVRVSQTFLTAYAFMQSAPASPEFVATVEELRQLAMELVPDPLEVVDLDTELDALLGGAA